MFSVIFLHTSRAVKIIMFKLEFVESTLLNLLKQYPSFLFQFHTSTFIIMSQTVLFLFSLCLLFLSVESFCPGNCLCDGEQAECVVSSCQSSFAYQYQLVSVRGMLCENQRRSLDMSGVRVYLFDDFCTGIYKCR